MCEMRAPTGIYSVAGRSCRAVHDTLGILPLVCMNRVRAKRRSATTRSHSFMFDSARGGSIGEGWICEVEDAFGEHCVCIALSLMLGLGDRQVGDRVPYFQRSVLGCTGSGGSF